MAPEIGSWYCLKLSRHTHTNTPAVHRANGALWTLDADGDGAASGGLKALEVPVQSPMTQSRTTEKAPRSAKHSTWPAGRAGLSRIAVAIDR
jgi:hypothetical protein